MYYIKMSKNTKVIDIHQFYSSVQREGFLLDFGFVEGSGVWYHPFTKVVAGLFELKPGEDGATSKAYTSCDKRFTRRPRFII